MPYTYPYLRLDNLELWTEGPLYRYVLWNVSADIKEFSRPIPESIRLRNWMVLAA